MQRALTRCCRLLADAAENGVPHGLGPGRHVLSDVVRARDALARRALGQPLVGETALGTVHGEHSGWGLPVGEAAATPQIIAALDVVDWIITAMGPADVLVVETVDA